MTSNQCHFGFNLSRWNRGINVPIFINVSCQL